MYDKYICIVSTSAENCVIYDKYIYLQNSDVFPDTKVNDFIDARWPHNPTAKHFQQCQQIKISLKSFVKLGFKNGYFSGIKVDIQSDLKYCAGITDFKEFPELSHIYGYDSKQFGYSKYNVTRSHEESTFCIEKGTSRKKLAIPLYLYSLCVLGTKYITARMEDIHMAVFRGLPRTAPLTWYDLVDLEMFEINRKGLAATMADLNNDTCDLIEDNKKILTKSNGQKVIDFENFLINRGKYIKRRPKYLLYACCNAYDPKSKKHRPLSWLFNLLVCKCTCFKLVL